MTGIDWIFNLEWTTGKCVWSGKWNAFIFSANLVTSHYIIMRAWLAHDVFGEIRAPFCVWGVCIIYQLHQHYSQMCVWERNRKSNLAPMPSSVWWNFTFVRRVSEKTTCHAHPYNCVIAVKSRHWYLKATKIPLCEDVLNICHRRKEG